MSVLFRQLVVTAVAFTALMAFGAIESNKKEFVLDLKMLDEGLIAQDDYEQARSMSEDRYRRAMATLDLEDHELWLTVKIHSMVLQQTTGRREAREKLQRIATEVENKFGQNSYSLVYVLTSLGEIQSGKEQVDTFQRTLQIQNSVFPDDILNYAGLSRTMGMAYTYNSKQYDHALQMLGVALPVYESHFGKNSEEVVYLHLAFGRAYAGFKAEDLVKASHAMAIEIAESLDNKKLEAEAWLMAGRNLSIMTGNLEASDYLDKALARYQQEFGDSHKSTAAVRLDVARNAIRSQAPGRAAEQLLQALNVFQWGSESRGWEKQTLELLVEAYEDLGQRDEATKYCLAISRIVPWIDDKNYQPVLKRAPKYPPEAVASGQEGYVVVEYTVDESGFIQSPKIVSSEGPKSFHDVSITAAYRFRYAPRLVNDVPEATPGVRNKFTFKFSN